MNMCLRCVRSPTLARGIPCPTLIFIDCDRGVRKPTLIIYSVMLSLKKLRDVRNPTLKRCMKSLRS